MLRSMIMISLIFPASVIAQDIKCPKGFQPYDNRCVTQKMSDYIMCVEHSGGNRSQISEIVSGANAKKSSAGVNVSAREGIVSGSVGAVINKSAEVNIVNKIETTWFPNGMSECSKVLDKTLRQNIKKTIRKEVKKSEKGKTKGSTLDTRHFSSILT
jgi:hypothetical protein